MDNATGLKSTNNYLPNLNARMIKTYAHVYILRSTHTVSELSLPVINEFALSDHTLLAVDLYLKLVAQGSYRYFRSLGHGDAQI